MYTTYSLTWQFVIEAVVLLSLPLILTYIAAEWDLKRMREQAEKQAEHKRILDILKRSE